VVAVALRVDSGWVVADLETRVAAATAMAAAEEDAVVVVEAEMVVGVAAANVAAAAVSPSVGLAMPNPAGHK